MLKMRVGSFLVSMAALTTFWGCSSPDSPIGCAQNDMKQTTAVVGNSPQTLQIAAAGSGQLWALSNVLVYTNDYRIYKYNSATNTWAPTDHFGIRITSSPSGICYHLNSGNEIWFGTGTAGYNIPKPSDFVSISDLSVCQQSSTYDQLWVLGTLSDGTKKIRLCYINTSAKTWSWDLNYVYYTVISGYSPIKIRRDPSSTTYAVIIYANAAGNRLLYATNNGGYTWNQQNITPSPADAAVWGTNVIFSYGISYPAASYCVKGTMNGSYSSMFGIGQGQERTVAIDYNSGLYTYTLNYNALVDKNPF
jgi:hypothetical protein